MVLQFIKEDKSPTRVEIVEKQDNLFFLWGFQDSPHAYKHCSVNIRIPKYDDSTQNLVKIELYECRAQKFGFVGHKDIHISKNQTCLFFYIDVCILKSIL